jgi:hypothetical protein
MVTLAMAQFGYVIMLINLSSADNLMHIVGDFKSTKVNETCVVLKIVYNDFSINEDGGLNVNSRNNNSLVCFYMRGECYVDTLAHGRQIHASVQALIDDGLVVNGRRPPAAQRRRPRRGVRSHARRYPLTSPWWALETP